MSDTLSKEETPTTPSGEQVGQHPLVLPLWIVVNVGCIECGVSTNIVGVFTEEARAETIAEKLNQDNSWREAGQNSYEVFAMPEPNEIAAEYREFFGENSEREVFEFVGLPYEEPPRRR